MRSTNRVYAYCAACGTHRDTARSSFGSEDLASFCEECGEELEELSHEAYIETLREDGVSWPIELRLSVPVKLNQDYATRICEAAGVDVLPFDSQQEYYIDEYIGNVPVTVTISKDGQYEISSVGEL